MAITKDFRDLIEVFAYSNLPLLMNPVAGANAISTVITPMGLTSSATANPSLLPNPVLPTTPTAPTGLLTSISPTVPTTPLSAITPTTVPLIGISPELLPSLQAAVLDNFTDLNLPADIQQLVQQFFAFLPSTPPIVGVTGAAGVTGAGSTGVPGVTGA